MSDGVIRWCDPPPVNNDDRAPSAPWSLIAHQLRSRPGEWGLVTKHGTAPLAARIERGVSWWAPPGSFEAVTRSIDGRVHVWVRYVGTA